MDTTGWLTIKVTYPLPLILSATLIRAIGTVWPEAVIDQADPAARDHLVLHVPNPNGRSDADRALVEVRDEYQDLTADGDTTAGSFVTGPQDGQTTVITPEDALTNLAAWALTVLEAFPDAPNYVEQATVLLRPVTGPDGTVRDRIAVAACWSEGQTPGELHRDAEARVTVLENLLADHGIDIPS